MALIHSETGSIKTVWRIDKRKSRAWKKSGEISLEKSLIDCRNPRDERCITFAIEAIVHFATEHDRSVYVRHVCSLHVSIFEQVPHDRKNKGKICRHEKFSSLK